MPHPTDRRLQRGIYRSPFLSRSGYRTLVAVDGQGRQVATAIVFRGDREREVARMLRRVLDRTADA